MKFYDENSTSYANSTFNNAFAKTVFSGMEDLVNMNNKKEPILDIGCGSGRDAKHLIDLGYTVHAFDQSPNMIKEAKQLTKLNDVFNVGDAINFESDNTYSLAYSIACLLHLNDEQFELAIKNIFKHINFGGYLYFTVKKGFGDEVDSNGRYFNYFTNEKLQSVFEKLNLHLLDVKENQDLTRPDTIWLNVMVQKPL